MSSTILYKFRASSTFEALPLPGSAARLFDVKKAIVKANKLDAGSMEFDLAVRNADSNEEYADESMLLPRGTRIIVQRLPAARGQGFLARIARNEHGGAMGNSYQHHQQQHPSGYYTIDSRMRDVEEEEFVDSSTAPPENNDDKELAALQAVTSMQAEGPTMVGGQSSMMGGHRGGRGGPPRPAGMGVPPPKPNFQSGNAANSKPGGNFRPNADPELREQEKKLMPKKRATGIPRTFLSLSAPPQTDGTKEGADGEQSAPLLQPNKQGFKELVSRGGGQSERTAGTRRDLDYVLKLTSTTVPEHLQCAICNNVVKNAMLLPWDSEGRTVCESCIRDALTQNGFRCPLTGMDGVSPDDLIPNVGLRKAAEMFIKGVMVKVDEIEQQQVEESETIQEELTAQSSEKDVLDGQGAEKGVLVSKRMALSGRKKSDDDPFGGGDDDFGGDVFAVEGKNTSAEEAESPGKTDGTSAEVSTIDTTGASESKAGNEEESTSDRQLSNNTEPNINEKNDETNEMMSPTREKSSTSQPNEDHSSKITAEEKMQKSPKAAPASSHMRFHRRRGPPVGYAMGPAGGAVTSARANQQRNNNYQGNTNGQDYSNNSRGGRDGGGYSPRGGGRNNNFHQDRNNGGSYGRGRGGRGRGGRANYRYDGDHQDNQSVDDNHSRGTKRGRDDHDDEGSRDGQQRRDRGGRGSHGRGGGGNRGGRGGRYQQRGNHRAGRGNYGGRDRDRY